MKDAAATRRLQRRLKFEHRTRRSSSHCPTATLSSRPTGMNNGSPGTESPGTFFAEIFEPEGEPLPLGARVTLWRGTTHDCHHASGVEDAEARLKSPEWANVTYFGVCPRSSYRMEIELRRVNEERRAAGKPPRRMSDIQGTKAAIGWFPGVWIDVDIDEPGKATKKSYPPTVVAAMDEIRKAIPDAEPTLAVSSGGGLHVYWLFAEGLIPVDDDDAAWARCEGLVRSFQAMVRDAFRAKGWDLDPTWACTRVLRIPGQYNAKYEPPRLVTWEKTGPRYSIDELELRIPNGLELEIPDSVEVDEGELQFELRSMDAQAIAAVQAEINEIIEISDIDGVLHEAWTEGLARDGQTFRPLKGYDQSSADLGLANRLLALERPMQFVIDAIRAHRAIRNPGDPKLNRGDYYHRTARKAAEGHRIACELPQATLAANAARKACEAATTAEERTEALAVIDQSYRAMLDTLNQLAALSAVTISGVFRSESVNSTSDALMLKFTNGKSSSVTVRQLLDGCSTFRAAVFSATGRMADRFSQKRGKPRQWSPVAEALLACAETVLPAEGHQAGEAMVRALESLLLSEHTSWLSPFCPAWHEEVPRKRGPLLWEARGRATGEPGLLVATKWWTEKVALDNELSVNTNRTPAANVRLAVRDLPHIERIEHQAFTIGERSSTVRGYIRVRRQFLVNHGGEGLGVCFDRARSLAVDE